MCEAQAGLRGVRGLSSGPELQEVAPEEPGETLPGPCHAALQTSEPRRAEPVRSSVPGAGSEFHSGLPSGGGVGGRQRLCQTPRALSSRLPSAICQAAAVSGHGKPFFPPGQLFISPGQEDIPRRSVSPEPCPALPSPGAIGRETPRGATFCRTGGAAWAPGARTASRTAFPERALPPSPLTPLRSSQMRLPPQEPPGRPALRGPELSGRESSGGRSGPAVSRKCRCCTCPAPTRPPGPGVTAQPGGKFPPDGEGGSEGDRPRAGG